MIRKTTRLIRPFLFPCFVPMRRLGKNVPEAIVACLACASIGAVWSSASPDFGLNAISDRFRQVKPKLIFATTHYQYSGKIFRTEKHLMELKKGLRIIASHYLYRVTKGDIRYIRDLWVSFYRQAAEKAADDSVSLKD